MNSFWSSENAIRFYRSHRSESQSLYRSESVFLQHVVANSMSLLDVGCAVGGFSKIIREFKSAITYTGVDISPRMIEEAHQRFPSDDFRVIDGCILPFADDSFDAVISFGVLHMAETWKTLLTEGWRVCRQHFLFDVRLVAEASTTDPATSYQKLAFDGKWDGMTTAPYFIVNIDEFMETLASLSPRPSKVSAQGYFHPVSEMTVSPYSSVCMSSFCLGKAGDGECAFEWGLPIIPGKPLDHLFSGTTP